MVCAFDASVPVTTIYVTDPKIAAIPEADRQVIAEKVTCRLAQEPGSYRVIKYIRQVVKRRDTGEMVTAAAAPNVLEKSAVDVSFLAAMLVDKFPLSLTPASATPAVAGQRYQGQSGQSDELGGPGD